MTSHETNEEIEPGTEVTSTDKPVDPAERARLAEELVQRYMLYAMAAGLVPAPGVDLAASIAIQVSLLKRLSDLYGVNFRENLGRGLIGSLLASGGAAALGAGLAGSAVKSIPVIGTIVGVIGMPILFGAYTFAVGKVFIAHFETGGTLIDFNIKDYRKYWDKMVSMGRRKAKEAKAAGATETEAAA
jgi:uncharacterized protein (DUF697 family)